MAKTLKNYVSVTKPGIILGNMISSAGGLFLASKGDINMSILLWTIIGISLVVASGCVFNNCIDRDMDRKMIRTQNRVLARGIMSPGTALVYASILAVSGTAVLGVMTNILCVTIVLTGFVIYVGIYSLYLKRNSGFATMFGSLAGAAPPVAAYCAVTHCLDTGTAILILIFCLWQVPHFYAVSVFRVRDFAAADIPVLSVRQGVPAAKNHIFIHIMAFTLVSPMLTLAGYTGYGYLAVAVAMGLSWLVMAWSGYRTSNDGLWARTLFAYSLLSITALNLMMAIDAAIPLSTV